jgi:hypothetical protein
LGKYAGARAGDWQARPVKASGSGGFDPAALTIQGCLFYTRASFLDDGLPSP